MKKENNAAVLTLFKQMLILKTFINDGIPLHNFEFQKKIVLLLTKDFFSRSFHSYKFFHERVSCVKSGT